MKKLQSQLIYLYIFMIQWDIFIYNFNHMSLCKSILTSIIAHRIIILFLLQLQDFIKLSSSFNCRSLCIRILAIIVGVFGLISSPVVGLSVLLFEHQSLVFLDQTFRFNCGFSYCSILASTVGLSIVKFCALVVGLYIIQFELQLQVFLQFNFSFSQFNCKYFYC